MILKTTKRKNMDFNLDIVVSLRVWLMLFNL